MRKPGFLLPGSAPVRGLRSGGCARAADLARGPWGFFRRFRGPAAGGLPGRGPGRLLGAGPAGARGPAAGGLAPGAGAGLAAGGRRGAAAFGGRRAAASPSGPSPGGCWFAARGFHSLFGAAHSGQGIPHAADFLSDGGYGLPFVSRPGSRRPFGRLFRSACPWHCENPFIENLCDPRISGKETWFGSAIDSGPWRGCGPLRSRPP